MMSLLRTATTGVSPVPWLRILNTRSLPAAKTQVWTGRGRVQVVRGNQSDREDGYVNSSGSNSFYSLTRSRSQRKEWGALRLSPPALERGQRWLYHIESDAETRSKSVLSFHSKWLAVKKTPIRSISKTATPVVQRSLFPRAFPGTQPASSLARHKMPQPTNTFGDPFLLDVVYNGLYRLVRLEPFLDKELWVGADDMRVQRGDSQVRRRMACAQVWSENVGIAVEAAC